MKRGDRDERSERRMRIALLAPANNVHTHKWLDYYDRRGIDVYVISLEPHRDTEERNWPRVRIRYLPLVHSNKAAYLLTVPRLRTLLAQADPDLVHAHYVSSYGFLGAMANRHPYVVSVWGSDIYDFPDAGPVQRRMVEFALSRADAICSTSEVMRARTARYTDKPIAVTPFGVDTVAFAPAPRPPDDRVVFGIVKTMDSKYGIDVLLRAFAELVGTSGPVTDKCDLVVVGGGPKLAEYTELAAALGLGDRVRFLGKVPHADVPALIQGFDVFVVPSVLDSESFGVAAVEAQACGLPVIVSAVGGLTEVVRDGVTGYVVPPRDPSALAAAMAQLAQRPELRGLLGGAGRAHAVDHYTWERNAALMLDVYARLDVTRK
ncbi:MAG TPA: glycosyltransferase [Sporichthyaceae bacterium]|nr:glycosyltransferase [Sporichthyaceae bacterium]